MARHKDADWNLGGKDGSRLGPNNWAEVQVAVLMDIRDELKGIRRRLDCGETLSMPRLLRAIARNTAKKKCARRVVK